MFLSVWSLYHSLYKPLPGLKPHAYWSLDLHNYSHYSSYQLVLYSSRSRALNTKTHIIEWASEREREKERERERERRKGKERMVRGCICMENNISIGLYAILLLCIFLSYFFIRKRREEHRGGAKLPPGSMGWPYVGETLQLYSQDPNVFFVTKQNRSLTLTECFNC